MYQKTQPETIQAAFASIASRYDLANAINSLGLHFIWNRALIKQMNQTTHLLDLCAGTGKIGLGFLKTFAHTKATLVDFCPQMLAVAEKKGTYFADRFQTICADATELPFKNNCFNGATIAYGIRNVKDPISCFKQAHRVLKPGSTFAILELTRPSIKIIDLLHRLYTKFWLPLTGRLLTADAAAYRYLATSVQNFIPPAELMQQLKLTGFKNITCRPLHFGIATLIICKK